MNIFIIISLFLIPILIFLIKKTKSPKPLPPGSLGLPLIGQTLSLLYAMRSNSTEKWLEARIQKYGPISKLSLFGKPTVFMYGQAANKLIFSGDGTVTGYQQTESMKMILGDRSLLGLSGQDHKRVRQALLSFLKPESLKDFVGKIDEEVNKHIGLHWHGKTEIKVLPLMKTLTFDIVFSLLFGIEGDTRRNEYMHSFQEMIEGVLSLPINLPFTRYNRSLKATTRMRKMLKTLLLEKKQQLNKNNICAPQDLITCLLNVRDKDNDESLLTETEIIHNASLVLIAGHDTSSTLLTFMIKHLANDVDVYTAVLQEQEEIAKSKSIGESLTWEDLSKMKYTWRVALETLRLIPPVLIGFRETLKDVEFGGYLIPKGWQFLWVSSMTHMDDTVFQEPSRFDPSRFENQTSIPPYSFMAFGGGPRLCPGYEFARIETLVAIHYIVTRFTWKSAAHDSISRDPMPTPAKGLPISIFPR